MPITPTPKIWMNGELVDWDKAQVHVLTHTLHYGTGVFEGIRAYETDQGPAGQRQVVQLVGVGGLDEIHLEAEAFREGSDQIMLKAACRTALALEEGRRFADRDDQPAVGFGRVDAAAGGQPDRCQTAEQVKQLGQRFPSLNAVIDRRFAGIIRASRRGGRVVECT